MPRTCFCPPWRLKHGLRWAFRWLPYAFLRHAHRVTKHNCVSRGTAEHEGYIDYAGRYLFYDRLVFQAWNRANRAMELTFELKRELLKLRNERGDFN